MPNQAIQHASKLMFDALNAQNPSTDTQRLVFKTLKRMSLDIELDAQSCARVTAETDYKHMIGCIEGYYMAAYLLLEQTEMRDAYKGWLESAEYVWETVKAECDGRKTATAK